MEPMSFPEEISGIRALQEGNESDTNACDILVFYLKYKYLSARQCADIFSSADKIYWLLLMSLLDETELRLSAYRGKLRVHGGSNLQLIPLCVDSAETGSSIRIRFSSKAERSGLKYESDDLEVIVPIFVAPLLVMGALFTGGAWSYERYLDIKIKELEIKQMEANMEASKERDQAASRPQETHVNTHDVLSKKQVEDVRKFAKKLLKTHVEHRGRSTRHAIEAHSELGAHIRNMQAIANQDNIIRFEINGIDVKKVDYYLYRL